MLYVYERKQTPLICREMKVEQNNRVVHFSKGVMMAIMSLSTDRIKENEIKNKKNIWPWPHAGVWRLCLCLVKNFHSVYGVINFVVCWGRHSARWSMNARNFTMSLLWIINWRKRNWLSVWFIYCNFMYEAKCTHSNRFPFPIFPIGNREAAMRLPHRQACPCSNQIQW